MRFLLALLVLIPPAFAKATAGKQDATPKKGVVIERTVKLLMRDTLDREREIQRKERVTFQDGNLKIEDLTFGEILLIRPDKKTVWTADPLSGTYSEHAFDQVKARRKEALDEIKACKDRVKGSDQELALARLLAAYGVYDEEPTVELKDLGKSETVLGHESAGRSVVVNTMTHLITVYADPRLADLLPVFETMAQIGAFHPAVAEKLKSLGGFPVKGTMRYFLYLDRVTAKEEVTAVTRGEIAASEFEIPKGLKKVPLKGFDAVEQRKVDKPKKEEKK